MLYKDELDFYDNVMQTIEIYVHCVKIFLIGQISYILCLINCLVFSYVRIWNVQPPVAGIALSQHEI